MTIIWKRLGSFSLGMLVGLTMVVPALAQENKDVVQIEIVNQDGEPVKASEIQFQGTAKAGGKSAGGIRVQRNQDGKLTVTDSDGNEQKIDVEGARSIIVNQSVETVDNNGEKQTKRVGKAIIIGPDGQRHEIDLGGGELGEFSFPGFVGVAKADRVNNSFMIGVNCEPVSPVLQSQLKLEMGVGLVVSRISADSPAQAAAIQQHDILMFADDTPLAKQSDLTESVQTAGKEKGKISLTIIRAGKKIGVDVTPVERPESENLFDGLPGVFQFPNAGGPGGINMQFRQMGPGVIIDKDFDGMADENFHRDIEQQMEAMRKQMDELHQQMQKQIEGEEIK